MAHGGGGGGAIAPKEKLKKTKTILSNLYKVIKQVSKELK
jgi:hypothetical protein